MISQGDLYFKRKRRVGRANLTQYRTLVSSPFNLGSVAAGGFTPNDFIVLSSIRFAISFSAPVAQGQLEIRTSKGRSFFTPALSANQVFKSEYFEKDLLLEISSDVAGNVSLFVVNGFGIPTRVASGVFT